MEQHYFTPVKTIRHSLHLEFILAFALALSSCQERRQTTVTEETQTGTSENQVPTPSTLPPPVADPTPAPETVRVPIPTDTQPNITIASPAAGSTVSSNPMRIIGTARTFENSFAYRVINAKGDTIAKGHGTAMGEMGHHNPYEASVTLPVPSVGAATVEVFEYSAKDGAEINKARVRITMKIQPDTSRKK